MSDLPKQDVEVLIVGAGPVGLTLAIELTLLSLRVRIVDKDPGTKHEPRACAIWSRSEELFADLGIVEKFEEAYHLHSVEIYGNGRHLGGLEMGHIQSEYPYPLVIEQHNTERILAESLAELGVQIEWGKEATDIRLHENDAEVILRYEDGSQEIATTQWVISCEGTRSVVREQLKIPFEGQRATNLQAVQVNAKPTWHYPESKSLGYFFLADHVSLMTFPIPGGGYRFFAFTTDPDPNRKTPPSLEEMRDLAAAVAHAPELRMELTEPIWLSRARFQDRIAATLRRGRALLAGDAAHAWAPIGGHGMNTGLRGAYNLGWKLAAAQRGEAKSHLLDTYSIEQRTAAQTIINEMKYNVLERPMSHTGMLAIEALLPLGLSLGAVQRWIEFTLSDLGMGYRESPLSWHRAGIRHLHAGDRVPNVPVVSDDGQWANLHRLLSFRHWTLLLRPGKADDEAVRRAREVVAKFRSQIHVAVIRPTDVTADRELGRDGLMMLVRPDAHIGLLARVDDTNILNEYLDTFLVRV